MRGFDIKHIPMRSFQISGLTAKWGIGGGRSPIWGNNLVAWWDARTFPDGALATIPNTATMEGKAPDLTVTGATMASGTLQFDGVDDEASTAAFLFPDRFTVFWDVDWLGTTYVRAGIVHPSDILLYNQAAGRQILAYIKPGAQSGIPNTAVAISTAGVYYSREGAPTDFRGTVGTQQSTAALRIANAGTTFAQMGFRQLLIFNKELSQAEVNDVLRAMFPA